MVACFGRSSCNAPGHGVTTCCAHCRRGNHKDDTQRTLDVLLGGFLVGPLKATSACVGHFDMRSSVWESDRRIAPATFHPRSQRMFEEMCFARNLMEVVGWPRRILAVICDFFVALVFLARVTPGRFWLWPIWATTCNLLNFGRPNPRSTPEWPSPQDGPRRPLRRGRLPLVRRCGRPLRRHGRPLCPRNL